jgi:hypothetical protein
MTRRLSLLMCLLLAGCISPGNYNLNVGIGPQAAASASPASGALITGASSSPATSQSNLPKPTNPSTAPSAATVTGPGRLDQAQESVASFQQIGEGTRLAQSFNVKATGQLVAVGLRLKAASGSNQDAALFVRSLDTQGHPGDPLGSATIHGQALPADGLAWTLASLDSPIALTAGTHYALELTYTGPHPIFAGAAPASSYPDGDAFTGLTDGSTFWNKLGQDLAFRTYLN